MNKKTIRFAGWALGLSMAVAGIGMVVGASCVENSEPTMMEANSSATYTIGWGEATGSEGTFANFTSTSGEATVETGKTISFKTAKNNAANAPKYNSSNSELRLYYNSKGNGGSITFDFSKFGYTVTGVVLTASTTPSVNYSVDGESAINVTAQNKTYTVSDIEAKSSITFQNANTSNTQLRIKTVTFTYATAAIEKGVAITGVTSDGLYLNGDSYDIGYKLNGFDSEPTITDVVWTVPSGAGSISDGKWTTGASATKGVKLELDLQADGEPYHAEVTTNIDAVAEFKKNSPKTKFSTSEAFSVGADFTVVYTYASSTGTIKENDAGITYRLENSDGTKLKDIVYGETKFDVGDSGNFVNATYRGVDLSLRYSITVLNVFDNTAGAYYLITDASQLSDGDHVTLFGHYDNGNVTSDFVPESFGSNNISAESVSFDNGAIDGSQSFTILDFVLEDTSASLAESFAFRVANDAAKLGNYLCASGAENNYLRTQSSVDENARFAVTIDGNTNIAAVKATASSNRNNMGANYNTGKPIFSCYGSLQDSNSLFLYKWASNTDVVQGFIDEYMHMSEEAYNKGDAYVGLCDAKNPDGSTPYSLARDAFNLLTSSQRSMFVGGNYADAYNRLSAWATANGETFCTDGNGETNVLKKASFAGNFVFSKNTNDSSLPWIVAVASVGVASIGAFTFLRKRKNEN